MIRWNTFDRKHCTDALRVPCVRIQCAYPNLVEDLRPENIAQFISMKRPPSIYIEHTESIFALITFEIVFMFPNDFRLLCTFFLLIPNQGNIGAGSFQCHSIHRGGCDRFAGLGSLRLNRHHLVGNEDFVFLRFVVVSEVLLLNGLKFNCLIEIISPSSSH